MAVFSGAILPRRGPVHRRTSPATSKPVCWGSRRSTSGYVTLTSVRQSPMTSRPTTSRPSRPQLRPERRGDLAVARRERPRHAAAAGRQVAARLARLRDARQANGTGLAGDQQHALVAVGDLGHVALRPSPCARRAATPSRRSRCGSGRRRARGRSTCRPCRRAASRCVACSSMNASISAVSRVTSVGAMNSANFAIASFSLWSRTARGRLKTRAPSRSARFEEVRRVDVLHVERRVLAHDHCGESLSARSPARPRGTSRGRRRRSSSGRTGRGCTPRSQKIALPQRVHPMPRSASARIIAMLESL